MIASKYLGNIQFLVLVETLLIANKSDKGALRYLQAIITPAV